jgi:multimeric flavodoxin WrbA
MKTVILFGSPRKEGNTIQLVNTFSETLKNKGHSVRMLYLNDMNIRPCQGCEACLKKGLCKINDDMKDTRKYMMESDLIVFASPVYWFNMSGQLKLAVDRFLAFMDEKYNSRIKGKKAVTLMTCGSDDPAVFAPAIDSFKMTFDLLALTYAGRVEATGCTEKGKVKEEFMTQARKLAESLA